MDSHNAQRQWGNEGFNSQPVPWCMTTCGAAVRKQPFKDVSDYSSLTSLLMTVPRDLSLLRHLPHLHAPCSGGVKGTRGPDSMPTSHQLLTSVMTTAKHNPSAQSPPTLPPGDCPWTPPPPSLSPSAQQAAWHGVMWAWLWAPPLHTHKTSLTRAVRAISLSDGLS